MYEHLSSNNRRQLHRSFLSYLQNNFGNLNLSLCSESLQDLYSAEQYKMKSVKIKVNSSYFLFFLSSIFSDCTCFYVFITAVR